MLTTFTLLVVTGGVLRLALGWGLHRRYQLDLSVPQALGGAIVMLAGLPLTSSSHLASRCPWRH